MKQICVCTETPHGSFNDYFEVDDDATDEAIAAEAADVFANRCNYGWYVVSEGESA